MKKHIIPAAIYAVFLFHTVMMLFFGQTGIKTLERLYKRKDILSENLVQLEDTKQQLARSLVALRRDSGAVEIEARSMGLYRWGEQVMVFQNLGNYKSLPDAGRVPRLEPLKTVNTDFFRMISVAVGICSIIIGLMMWKRNDAYQSKRR